jgi:hypothetical protein
MATNRESQRRRFSLELPVELLARIDALKAEWGLRSRGDIVDRLLQELLTDQNTSDDCFDSGDSQVSVQVENQTAAPVSSAFNEQGALVLMSKGAAGDLALDREEIEPLPQPVGKAPSDSRQVGIDLPGFVRRQSDQLKRSLQPRRPEEQTPVELFPHLEGGALERALIKAQHHWIELYGKPANEAVLEAAMVWLAQDIWPLSDQSEGRLFTWTLACDVVENVAPNWAVEPANFGRVMVIAGLLEDPFSTSTLDVRLPTLIHRFVHRFRKRRKGTSFQALEHTMTLHGALKLLQLPTLPGHRLKLSEIRDAYRELAMSHHPDSGGNEDTMRRLNEAYQLLKELYRNT